jgi:hypothetical protein
VPFVFCLVVVLPLGLHLHLQHLPLMQSCVHLHLQTKISSVQNGTLFLKASIQEYIQLGMVSSFALLHCI